MGRVQALKNSVAFVGLLVSICCIFVLTLSLLRLPDVSLAGNRAMMMGPYKTSDNRKERVASDVKLGEFGEMMVRMLPDDLAFTVFVPSERAFERDLGLRAASGDVNDGSRKNDTYAVVSRVLGFSAVPRALHSTMVASGEEVSYDSLSGLTLFVSKNSEGVLVVNRISAERVDIRRKKIVVHVMDGVIMDAEFEQSVQPDLDEATD